ncbi:MAG: PfkB family carbohydrate kinase, partial [bacterium]|nr:PfkB family carbohydrate kinase [bacterium]
MDSVGPGGAVEPVEAGAPLDVFLHGPLFFDLVFTGLDSLPVPGTEIHSRGMGSLPGGIANLAVATARLGLRTGLAAGFGNDVYGGWCRAVLTEEGVDLTRSRVVEQHTNVTVSMSHGGDRAMLTHGHELAVSADELIGVPPVARAVVTDLTGSRAAQSWWRSAAGAGAWIFADVGWDATGEWCPSVLEPLEHCHAFAPNAAEAMAFTRSDSPEAALGVLGERVPLAVVTLGADGAIARDRETGEEARSAGIPVELVDPTGAGDNF